MASTHLIRVPHCTRHATGQAVVRLNGKDHYLGKWNSATAKTAYERLISQWLARGRCLPDSKVGLTVNALILAYWQHCTQHYRKDDGTPSSELDLVRLAMRPLKELYGRTFAAGFGPLSLKAVRQRMIAARISRGVINAHVGRIKRMFRWAVENELVPPSTYHGLQAVIGLQRGRTAARETGPVKPVPESLIQAVVTHVSPPVRAMIELQLLTGMRPGEACIMRGCDLDTSKPIWVYRPESHKTQHHGHQREIYLGPRAQATVRPWLKLDTHAYLFSPAEAESARNGQRRRDRKSPITPSQANRKPKGNRRRPWRDHYDVTSYRRAIQRACDKAFPPAEGLSGSDLKLWHREHRWRPHRLRHNAATNLRREFGVELARIILGHSTAFTTEIYAEVDRQRAIDVMGKIG